MGKIQVAAVKAHDEILKRRGEITFIDAFVSGYNQAEKDLALTWRDVKNIVTIADSMLTHTACDDIDHPDEQKFYEEVLRTYNKMKDGQ